MTGSERFGANLRDMRLRQRLTQEQLGEKVGADGPRIGRLEKGSENPTLETIDRLGAALDVDVSEFHFPRPEEASGHEQRPRQRSAVLQAVLDQLDIETPGPDSWQGDVVKAVAALARALGRETDPGASGDATAKARS